MIVDLVQDRDLEQLLDRSNINPVIIFKHSTQCSVSTQAYEEIAAFVESTDDLVCGAIRVIENRSLSNTIAERFGVRHETPQALVIKNGRVVWHASHWSITPESINDALVKHAQPTDQRN